MTAKLIVILLAFVGGIYSLILNIVEHRSANNPTPANLADVYDSETYEKWKKYSAEHSRLSIVSSIVSIIVTVVLLFTNVYASFASLFPNNFFMQIFSVILLETVVGTLVGVIESYVSNMIIEQKYGFNRTSIKTFIADRIRSLILGLVLSMALAFLIAGCHANLGAWMILLFAACVFAFSMVISFLYPFFSRIGNKFTPLEDGELKDRLLALLEKYGYKVKAIEVMDASRRTTKLNAYFTGFGKMKTIVLYDNLLEAMTTDEICAVFAHELGHGLNKDVLRSQILNIGNLILMSVIAWGAAELTMIYPEFGFAGVNYGFTYILFAIGLALMQPLTGLIMNANSRFAEYRADRQAVKEGYGEAMIGALKKLAKDNFAHLSPSKINVVLQYSHPPLDRRVENVEKAMKETGKSA